MNSALPVAVRTPTTARPRPLIHAITTGARAQLSNKFVYESAGFTDKPLRNNRIIKRVLKGPLWQR